MVVVEVKAVDTVPRITEAQLLTYLKLGGWKVGLLINFHVPVLSKGIKRLVLGLQGQDEYEQSLRLVRTEKK
jgi:GxxExxY protein